MNAPAPDDGSLTGGLPPLLWAKEGARQALTGPAWAVGLALIGIGGLAQDVGHSWALAALSTFLVWAGPAQVIFFGVPMCVSLLPLLRRPGQGAAMSLYTVHHIAVTGWVESIRRLPGMPQHARLPWFLGLVHGLYFAASIATVAGFVLSGTVPREIAAGLLFVTPIYFIAALVRNSREPIDWLALALGFALTPLLKPLIGAGFDLLAVGLVGGTAAWAAQRWLNARKAEAGR